MITDAEDLNHPRLKKVGIPEFFLLDNVNLSIFRLSPIKKRVIRLKKN